MKRQLSKLSAKAIAAAKRPGYYGDGGGLYLQVSSFGTKSWVFRYTRAGKAREMGLGPLHTVPLATQPHPFKPGEKIIGARDKAADCRRLLTDGIDPIKARDTARKAEHASRLLDAARAVTFKECAENYIKAHRAGWKNAKHAEQWTNTIETYCGPVIGPLPVQAVDTGLVLKVLEPIWTEKAETATRLRARIEKVLDWATVRNYRTGDNPARWRGHLDKLLPKLEKRKRVQHHAALPYGEVGAFMETLGKLEGTAARALEFTILTAARTGEVIGAKWDEVDLDAALWTIPAARTKTHREHRVPLSPRAVKLLQGMRAKRQNDYVFPGQKENAPLSNMAMLQLLERMERDDLTVHGFRSTFRDWAAERTSYPREVCEMALGHAVSDQVEAAYRRGDLFEKRRRLMADWAKYCATPPQAGNVVPMKRRKA